MSNTKDVVAKSSKIQFSLFRDLHTMLFVFILVFVHDCQSLRRPINTKTLELSQKSSEVAQFEETLVESGYPGPLSNTVSNCSKGPPVLRKPVVYQTFSRNI